MMGLVSAKDDQDLKSVLRESKKRLVVVDFGTKWCEACNKLKPDFERFAGEYTANSSNSPLFVTADLEKLPEIARQIRKTPTVAYYKNGVKVDEVSGAYIQRVKDHTWLHAD